MEAEWVEYCDWILQEYFSKQPPDLRKGESRHKESSYVYYEGRVQFVVRKRGRLLN
jgi:hypothetical protein